MVGRTKVGDTMARPRKDGMDYFPHDTDAVNDEKIEILRALYGNDGYTFYFILLERIYRAKEFELDVSEAETIQILARKTGLTVEKFNQILDTALKYKCFDADAYEKRDILTSNGIKKRASVVIKKREKMRENYKTEKEIVSEAERGGEIQQSKVKKSKGNKRKNKYAEFVSITEEEYKKLTDKYGEELTQRMIEILDNYKGATGKKYKDDYRAILSWVAKKVLKEQEDKAIETNENWRDSDKRF